MVDKLSDLLVELMDAEELDETEGKQIAIIKLKEVIFWLTYAEEEIKK